MRNDSLNFERLLAIHVYHDPILQPTLNLDLLSLYSFLPSYRGKSHLLVMWAGMDCFISDRYQCITDFAGCTRLYPDTCITIAKVRAHPHPPSLIDPLDHQGHTHSPRLVHRSVQSCIADAARNTSCIAQTQAKMGVERTIEATSKAGNMTITPVCKRKE